MPCLLPDPDVHRSTEPSNSTELTGPLAQASCPSAFLAPKPVGESIPDTPLCLSCSRSTLPAGSCFLGLTLCQAQLLKEGEVTYKSE